jgi:hypothetical protein
MSSDFPFRVDLLGPGTDEEEKIGVVFDAGLGSSTEAVAIDLTPEEALELAARISDVYALHKRWVQTRQKDPLAHPPEPLLRTKVIGLDVESWRLRQLLQAGYPLRDAERLARDKDVDLHRAVDLAQDAGLKLALEILR